MSDLLVAKNIRKEYPEAGGKLVVLDDLSLTVRKSEMLAVTGPSGVGKSTLLHLLGLLDTPTSGSVTYGEIELGSANAQSRARLRNSEFGFVFQFYHLLPDLDALSNVMLPAMIQTSWFGWAACRSDVRDRALQALSDIGLANRAGHKPGQLSGGEKQRIAIARALMNGPAIVFCDEPTGNLDEKTSEQIHDLLWTINAKRQTTFVIVTHDEILADRCDRVARMHAGTVSEIVEKGG